MAWKVTGEERYGNGKVWKRVKVWAWKCIKVEKVLDRSGKDMGGGGNVWKRKGMSMEKVFEWKCMGMEIYEVRKVWNKKGLEVERVWEMKGMGNGKMKKRKAMKVERYGREVWKVERYGSGKIWERKDMGKVLG